MHVIGVDLSGPGSPQNTAVAVCRVHGEVLEFVSLIASVDDRVLYEEIRQRLAADDVPPTRPSAAPERPARPS